MKLKRYFTLNLTDPYQGVSFSKRESSLVYSDGRKSENIELYAPDNWSQMAVDIMAQKYRCKSSQLDSPENDVRQIIGRLVKCWLFWAKESKLIEEKEELEIFSDELTYMLIHQMASPNSPQWFNTGLYHSYGIQGPGHGHYSVDHESGKVFECENSYERPQSHACFIQSLKDDLLGEDGIAELWLKEARLFKFGSGTGTNFSKLRGDHEPLSGGGISSGLMSWLKVSDSLAGAIKSGGVTRRAAKMVCLDLDHPDIFEFITWKAREEEKVAALVLGQKELKKYQMTLSNQDQVSLYFKNYIQKIPSYLLLLHKLK